MRYLKRIFPVMCLMWCVMAFNACDHRTAMAVFRDMPETGWEANDTVGFPLDSVEQSGRYVLTLTLRLTAAERYPFSDMALELTRCLPADTLTTPLYFTLTTGRSDMAGNGVSLYAYDFPIDTLDLHTGEEGRFVLRHRMRLSPLPGIHDVGLSLKLVD